jgi:hypothetical protein
VGTAFIDVFPVGWPAAAYYRLATADLLPSYKKCLFLSKITFGKTKTHYKDKACRIEHALRKAGEIK